jgi:hypothetical protein
MKHKKRSRRSPRLGATPAASTRRGYTAIVDLPNPLPVTEAEIELLERELADFLAELLRG